MKLCIGTRYLALCLSVLTLLSPLGNDVAGGQTPNASAAGSELSGPLLMLSQYQARGPRKCTKVTKPPSVAQASVMVQCTMDGLASTGLTLIQDVKIEMGAPRPFVYRTDAGLAGIDLNATVYPLRGSYSDYFCRTIGNGVPAGHSCIRSAMESEGWCWKTSFGDWTCKMHGGVPPKLELGMPAPTTY